MSDTEAPYAEWSIVELMGRNRVAGYVTADAPIMSATRLRVDVYDGDQADPSVTQYLGFPQGVYRLTPTTEEIARRLGARIMPAPVARFELEPPKPRQPDPWDDDVVDAVIHVADCTGDCDGECSDD